MASIWLTYCWADNDSGDVDFVKQELEKAGLEVRMDRYELGAGVPLWDQIAEHIGDRSNDAWVIYTTEASLTSESCREELRYALQRAIEDAGAGGTFPLIGLFPAPVDSAIIPPAIKARLYVVLTDPGWAERIVAAAEARTPVAGTQSIPAIGHKFHAHNAFALVVEVWPRAGNLQPFFYAVLEKEGVGETHLRFAARGHVPQSQAGAAFDVIRFSGAQLDPLPPGIAEPGLAWAGERHGSPAATPALSAFILCPKKPSIIIAGQENGRFLVIEP